MIRTTVCFVVAVTFSSNAVLAEEGVPPPSAKATVLRAVAAFFLEPDQKEFAAVLDSQAQWKNRGEGSAAEAVRELAQEGDQITTRVCVKEIIFFTTSDLPRLKQRFSHAHNMWRAERVPARVVGGFGCLVVWRDLADDDPEEIELNVLILKKLGDAYKVVYLDDT